MPTKTTVSIYQPTKGQPVQITFTEMYSVGATGRIGQTAFEKRTITITQEQWNALKDDITTSMATAMPPTQTAAYCFDAAYKAAEKARSSVGSSAATYANIAVAYSNLAFVAERQERRSRFDAEGVKERKKS